MIKFQYVRWRNFLSTGNVFNEIQLNRSNSTLVVGTNGGGKSTFIDAICFALFNKPFRNINKGQLINSINKKDCEVEICFEVGTKRYRVIRGIKPNKFEIFLDDVLINQDAANKDYQEYLEESILKLNYKSFTQMSILGAANYTPFMQLPAATRREVIEDLLDISVFSRMNEVLKKKIVNHKEELGLIEKDLEVGKVKLESQERLIENIEKNNKERIKQIDANIEESKKTIKENKDKILFSDRLHDEIDHSQLDIIQAKIDKKTEKKDKLIDARDVLLVEKKSYSVELEKPLDSDELTEIEKNISSLKENIEKLKKDKVDIVSKKNSYIPLDERDDDEYIKIKADISVKEGIIKDGHDEISKNNFEKRALEKDNYFFCDNDTCPTCTQDIDPSFKKNKIAENDKFISELEESIVNNEKIISDTKKSVLSLKERLSDIESSIEKLNQQKLKQFEDDINAKQEEIDNINDAIKEKTEAKYVIEKKLNDERNVYMKEIDNALDDVRTRLDNVQREINDINSEHQAEKQRIDREKQDIEKAVVAAENDIKSEQTYISKLEKEKESIQANVGDIEAELSKKNVISKQISNLENDVNDKHDEKRYLDMTLSILKDNGIKTMIIKQYVPVINKLVNSYLQTQDLFVQFELDETFNESIKSRHRDDFSYASFSEGEKARIDISILLAFRAIARMKSTSSTDLLLLDETFDSSIDADGSDALSNILKTLQDTYVFVISHNEKMFDKFRSVVKFSKINNYSIMV